MSDTLSRLLDIPDRMLADPNHMESERLIYEYMWEKILSILIYREIGIKRSDINFDSTSSFKGCPQVLALNEDGTKVNLEDAIQNFYDRYLWDCDNIYYDFLKKIFSGFLDLYILEPKKKIEGIDGTFTCSAIEHLFSKCGYADLDISGFSSLYPHLESSLSEYFKVLYDEDEEISEECADTHIYAVRSEKLGILLSDKESELYKKNERAIKVFTEVFGDKVVDGVYWGYELYGDNSSDYYYETYPLILQPAFIAACIQLNKALC